MLPDRECKFCCAPLTDAEASNGDQTCDWCRSVATDDMLDRRDEFDATKL